MRKNFVFTHNGRLCRVANNPRAGAEVVNIEYVGRYNAAENFLYIRRSRGRVMNVPVEDLRPAHPGARFWFGKYMEAERQQQARGQLKHLNYLSYSEKYEKNLLG
jgi:hypothetical protein